MDMKKVNDSTLQKFEVCELADLSKIVGGAEKTGAGSCMLDEVEMCYEKDKVKKNGDVKYTDLKPCDCEC